MPYKKGGAAYRLSKMRRSLQRRADTIERQIARGKFSGSDISSAQKIADEYRRQASRLYTTERIDGKRVSKSEQEVKSLERRGESVLGNAIDLTSNQARRNLITQTEINQAGEPISRYTEDDVSTFYRATQRLWEGKSGNRNEIIMDALGIDNLEEAFDTVLDSVKEQAQNTNTDGIEVSSEAAPELGEAQPSTELASYETVFVGFDITNLIERLKTNNTKTGNTESENKFGSKIYPNLDYEGNTGIN